MEKKNWIMGLWKFRDSLPQEELEKLAAEWAEDPRYLQLYIRKTADNEQGVGFTYDLGDADTESNSTEYAESISDALRRRFGNDLKGWSMGSPVTIIK